LCFKQNRWPLRDEIFYQRLKREGFRGQFVLYFPYSDKIKYLEDLRTGDLEKYLGKGVATLKGT